jgi:hypothetical protein
MYILPLAQGGVRGGRFLRHVDHVLVFGSCHGKNFFELSSFVKKVLPVPPEIVFYFFSP